MRPPDPRSGDLSTDLHPGKVKRRILGFTGLAREYGNVLISLVTEFPYFVDSCFVDYLQT